MNDEKQFDFSTQLELLDPEDSLLREEFSAVSLSPLVNFCKFILSDDKPNANKKRIPIEEFDNIIKSGIYMPIKMAFGGINDGHDGSSPIGVITHLKKSKDKILGLAALWNRERPDDVSFIKDAYKRKEPLELSWEILYTDVFKDEISGVEDLKNCVLRATTFVRRPAYEGRTPVLEVAARTEDATVQNGGTVENTEETNLETNQTEVVTQEAEVVTPVVEPVVVTEVQSQMDMTPGDMTNMMDNTNVIPVPAESPLDPEPTVDDLLNQISVLKVLLAEKVAEVQDLTQQNIMLAEFKASVEKDKKVNDRLLSIRRKFDDANIKKNEEYFSEKKEDLLALDDASLDFMIQEMVSFAISTTPRTDHASVDVPQVQNRLSEKPTKDEIVEFLKKYKN